MDNERFTLSSLLSSLIEVEKKLSEFYQDALMRNKGEDSTYYFQLHEEHEQTEKAIEQVKRGTIIEFALEPISGIEVRNSLKTIEETISNQMIDDRKKASIIEEATAKLFEEASTKVAHMSAEASMLLLNANKRIKRRQ